MKRSLAIAALWILWVAGCAHQGVLEKPIRDIGPEGFWADQRERRALLSEFSGRLRLSYQSKGEGVSGKGRVVGRYPNAFRLELRDAIGRLHYVLVAQKNEFTAHYPRARRALRDTRSGRPYFLSQWGASIPLPDAVGLFAGVLPPSWERVKPLSWEWDRSQGAFRGQWKAGGENLVVWVNSDHASLKAVEWESPAGKLRVRYSDFELLPASKGAQVALGYEAAVQVGEGGALVEVVWDTLERPTRPLPDTAFQFKLPPGDTLLQSKTP